PVSFTVRRIDPLLSLYAPSVVVLKHLNGALSVQQRKRVISAVRRQLARHPVEVHMIKRSELRLAFLESGNQNKYQIAATVANSFPELRCKLPPKRKPYQPERYNAVVFDAVALGLAHQLHCGACNGVNSSEA